MKGGRPKSKDPTKSVLVRVPESLVAALTAEIEKLEKRVSVTVTMPQMILRMTRRGLEVGDGDRQGDASATKARLLGMIHE